MKDNVLEYEMAKKSLESIKAELEAFFSNPLISKESKVKYNTLKNNFNYNIADIIELMEDESEKLSQSDGMQTCQS